MNKKIFSKVLLTRYTYSILCVFLLVFISTIKLWCVPLLQIATGLKITSGYTISVSFLEKKISLSNLEFDDVSFLQGKIEHAEITLGMTKNLIKSLTISNANIFLDFEDSEDNNVNDSYEQKSLNQKIALFLFHLKNSMIANHIFINESKISFSTRHTCTKLLISSLSLNKINISEESVFKLPYECHGDFSYDFSSYETHLKGYQYIDTILNSNGTEISAFQLKSKNKLYFENAGTEQELPIQNVTISISSYDNQKLSIHLNSNLMLNNLKEYQQSLIENLQTDFLILLQCENNQLQGTCKFNLSTFNRHHNIPLIHPSCSGQFSFGYQLLSQKISVNSFRMNLSDGYGGKMHATQNNPFSFNVNSNRKLTFVPSSSTIHFFTLSPFKLANYKNYLPDFFHEQLLSFQYTLSLDPLSSKIYGNTQIYLEHETQKNNYFLGKMNFETNGISDINHFSVTDSSFLWNDGEQIIFQGNLTGDYNLTKINLAGEINYYPWEICKRGGDSLISLKKIFEKFHGEKIRQNANASFSLDFTDMLLTWKFFTKTAGFYFTHQDGSPVNIAINGEGKFKQNLKDNITVLSANIQAESKNDFNWNISLLNSNDKSIHGKIEFVQWNRYLLELFCNEYLPSSCHFSSFFKDIEFNSLSGGCEYTWNILEDEPTIKNSTLHFTCSNNSFIEIIKKDSLNLSDIQHFFYQDCDITTRNFPLIKCNKLLPEKFNKFFIKGNVSGDFSVKFNDSKNKLFLDVVSLTGEDVFTSFDGRNRSFGRIRLNSSIEIPFQQNNSRINIKTIAFDIYDTNDSSLLHAIGEGNIDKNNYNTDLHFQEACFGKNFLNSIQYGAQSIFAIDDIILTGELDYHIKDKFQIHESNFNLNLKKLQLLSSEPWDYKFPEIHGSLLGKLMWKDQALSGNAQIIFTDDKEINLLKAIYSYKTNGKEKPNISIQTIDLNFLESYFIFNLPCIPDETVFSPPDMPIFDLHFDIDDLYCKNIFHDQVSFDLSVNKNILKFEDMKFSGDIDGNLFISLDFSTPDVKYCFEPQFFNFPISIVSPLLFIPNKLNLFLDKNLTCDVSFFYATIKGMGFSNENIRENMEIEGTVNLENLFYKTEVQQLHTFSILQLPITIIPNIIDNIPNILLRNFLKTITFSGLLEILSNNRNFVYQDGVIEFDIKKNICNIQRINLDGYFFDSFSGSGLIQIDEPHTISMSYKIRTNGFVLPIFIDGTREQPDINYRKTLLNLGKDNAANMLMLMPNLIIPDLIEEP